jgi:hypothetical protein
MAKTTTRHIEGDVEKELEDALDLDLVGVDVVASMEDLETQIAQAADELVRESRAEAPASGEPAASEGKDEDAPLSRLGLRPVETASQPAAPTAANDDRQKDFRALATRLERRPSRAVYWIVAVLSLAWLGGAAYLADRLFGPEIWQAAGFESWRGHGDWIALAVSAVVPVLLFWAFAVMIRRSQEMRLAAQSMAEAAFRLADPEAITQDRVMTVGQAIRREVAAMGEGIERTLARAVELETLVHSEVNQI